MRGTLYILRINRNIVECKDARRAVPATHFFRINRNIVECKVSTLRRSSMSKRSINRNIVECKGVSAGRGQAVGGDVLIET